MFHSPAFINKTDIWTRCVPGYRTNDSPARGEVFCQIISVIITTLRNSCCIFHHCSTDWWRRTDVYSNSDGAGLRCVSFANYTPELNKLQKERDFFC
ncbi:hypothetical protein CEXT_33941 [Caerostris extrusa]|uniref:Uncharacterized protein n=1 Tax=Caerostris extrusa TaxID=172846 RepID=A0AAV4N4I5_CAEEX|nr:hypothetical protein CEXT_33941 [Caerostris extrusa]